MVSSRSFTGLLVALTLGLAVGLVASPASAQEPKLIQGQVVDQVGHPVDDVTVQAFDEAGDPVASALTYDNDAEDGAQHGYFWLEVTPGTFSVQLSKDGYVTETIEEVVVGRGRPRASLGEVVINREPVATETECELVDDEITTAQRAKVRVKVTNGKVKTTGKVLVKHGRTTIASTDLKGQDRGQVAVTLKKLAKGTYNLRVVFVGSKLLKQSSSSKFTLVVKPARHPRQVPNALAWVG